MIYTNSNARRDLFRNALEQAKQSDEPVFIAVAFFTDYEMLKQISGTSRAVKLVVRLGFPTSPDALRKALTDPYVSVRYFNDSSFHPKMYLFGDRLAYVGSANLTNAACNSNQEVVVEVPASDDCFNDLASVFDDYWQQAAVLTAEALDVYQDAYKAHLKFDAQISLLEKGVNSTLGLTRFENIDRGAKAATRQSMFIDSYRRTYQETTSAFDRVREEYALAGVRKVADPEFPLRLEIDSFFSFVRDHIATVGSWNDVPLGWSGGGRERMRLALDAWHKQSWAHLEEVIVGTAYPRLNSVFSSAETIQDAGEDELFEALRTLHSFHDRLRFHAGGTSGLRDAFMCGNPLSKIKHSLTYLVHGEDEVVNRMGNLIFNPEMKLRSFGTANVQELIGWKNKEDLPVVNGRTTKVLRYFGFDIKQL